MNFACVPLIVAATGNLLARTIKPWHSRSGYCVIGFHDAEAYGMPKENNNHIFEGCEPSPLFRGFAAECIELAQAAPLPEKRALYAKMASVWYRMAQRWEKKS